MILEMNACVVILEWGLPSSEHRQKSPGRCAHELAAWGLVSRQTDSVEDVENRELDVGVVGSRVGESLGRITMTPEKELVG